MKNFSYILKSAIIATFAMFLAMCANGSSNNNYRNAIPKDALFVFSINPNSISEKAEIGDVKTHSWYQKIVSMLEYEGMTPDQVNYIKSILEEPENVGVDAKQPAYVFCVLDEQNSSSPRVQGGLVLKMKNKAKFEEAYEFFNNLAGGEFEKKKSGGCDVIVIEDRSWRSVVCAYDEETIMIYGSQDDSDNAIVNAVRFLKQDRSKSILANKDIASRLEDKNDMDMIVAISNMSEKMVSEMPMPAMYKRFLGTDIAFKSNFEKGKIASQMSMFFKDKDTEKAFLEFDASAGKQKGDLLKYLSEDSFFVMGATVDGAKMYDILSSMKEFAMIRMIPFVKDVLSAIEGDILVGVSNPEISQYDFNGGITAMITVKDTKIVDTLLEQVGDMFEKTGSGQYTIDLRKGENSVFTLGVKDKIVYFTNSKETLDAFNGKKIKSYDNSLFKGSYATLALDMNTVSDIAANTGGYSARQAAQVLKMFSDVEISSKDRFNADIDVKMSNKSQNAAKTIYEVLSALVEENM